MFDFKCRNRWNSVINIEEEDKDELEEEFNRSNSIVLQERMCVLPSLNKLALFGFVDNEVKGLVEEPKYEEMFYLKERYVWNSLISKEKKKILTPWRRVQQHCVLTIRLSDYPQLTAQREKWDKSKVLFL